MTSIEHTAEDYRNAVLVIEELRDTMPRAVAKVTESLLRNALRAAHKHADDELAQAMRYGSGALRLEAWAETAEDIRQYWRNAARAAREFIEAESAATERTEAMKRHPSYPHTVKAAPSAPIQAEPLAVNHLQPLVADNQGRIWRKTTVKQGEGDPLNVSTWHSGVHRMSDWVPLTRDHGPLHQAWDKWEHVPEGVVVMDYEGTKWVGGPRGALSGTPGAHPFLNVEPLDRRL